MVFNRIKENFGKPQNHQIIRLFKIQKHNINIKNSKIADILNDYFPNILTSLRILEIENNHHLLELHIPNSNEIIAHCPVKNSGTNTELQLKNYIQAIKAIK